ncbi:hypothetical protein [Conchiformibius kuhniae]|uniref:Transferrin-binding protein-like solute binding protein n=1 Tax=Conchiformibius kuhniae TaxID=211502 RepID=A0A8T9MV90_9NEIS|nr:hypothetical protein [Conchiformibius kuhniae]
MPYQHKQSALILLAAFALAACGGSGGGSHRPQTQSKPTPPAVQPPEHNAQNGTAPAPKKDDAKPSVPAAPPADMGNAKPSDQEVFARLSLYNTQGGVLTTDALKLTLPENGKEISIALLKPNEQFIGKPAIHTLRDAEGRLLGYYGHATANHINRDPYTGEITGNSPQAYYVQHMDERSLTRPAAAHDIRYSGKMYFRYPDNSPLATQTASVQATYHGSDKTLSMELIADRHSANRWYLFDQRDKYAQDGSRRQRSDRVAVDADGRVSGHLLFDENGTREKLIPNGHFIGGFYGKNGGVLSGRAVNEGGHGEKWEGVLGATLVKPE